jgi:vesicle-associated membrane protein 7
MATVENVAVIRAKVVIASFGEAFTIGEPELLKLVPTTATVNAEQKIAFGKLFTFVNSAGLVFVATSPQSADKKRPISFLETVARRWATTFGPASATAASHALDAVLAKDFEPLYNEYNKTNKAQEISRQLEETQSILKESVSKALGRGEDLDVLSTKSEELMTSSEEFRGQATNLKWRMRLQYIKSFLWTTAIVVLGTYIVLALACGGFSLKDCR